MCVCVGVCTVQWVYCAVDVKSEGGTVQWVYCAVSVLCSGCTVQWV